MAVDSNILLLDLDEIWCMGVIDHGDSHYGIGSYVTSCFDCEAGSGCRNDIVIEQFLWKMV